MKNGIVVTTTGVVFILATLILSSGHHPARTFLGNIQEMELVLVDGTWVPDKDKEIWIQGPPRGGDYYPHRFFNPDYIPAHYQGRVTIPTKYPLVLSLVVTAIGVLIMLTYRTTRSKSDTSA